MRARRRWLSRRVTPPVALLAAAVLAATAAVWLPSRGSAPAPRATFLLIGGQRLALAGLRGAPVLVSFWATSCRPCLRELPRLTALYQDLHPRGLELIAVAMPYDPPARVQALRLADHLPYAVALDLDGAVTRAFGGVPYIPAAFLISPEGRIVWHAVGTLDVPRIRRIVLDFGARRPGENPRPPWPPARDVP